MSIAEGKLTRRQVILNSGAASVSCALWASTIRSPSIEQIVSEVLGYGLTVPVGIVLDKTEEKAGTPSLTIDRGYIVNHQPEIEATRRAILVGAEKRGDNVLIRQVCSVVKSNKPDGEYQAEVVGVNFEVYSGKINPKRSIKRFDVQLPVGSGEEELVQEVNRQFESQRTITVLEGETLKTQAETAEAPLSYHRCDSTLHAPAMIRLDVTDADYYIRHQGGFPGTFTYFFYDGQAMDPNGKPPFFTEYLVYLPFGAETVELYWNWDSEAKSWYLIFKEQATVTIPSDQEMLWCGGVGFDAHNFYADPDGSRVQHFSLGALGWNAVDDTQVYSGVSGKWSSVVALMEIHIPEVRSGS